MATREEILEKIGRLEGEIREIETERRLATTDKDERISLDAKITAIRNEITAKENRLTALITSQQGNFSSHISIVLSQSSRCNLCPISFDISSSSIQVRRLLKVRCDGLK
jgi:hypothetical protein